MEKLIIAGKEFESRLFLGTGKFNSNQLMEEAILASGTEMVTVAMKRIELDNKEDDMLKHIIHPHIQLLPEYLGRAHRRRSRVRRTDGPRSLRHQLAETGNPSRPALPVAGFYRDPEGYGRTGETGIRGIALLPGRPDLCKRLEEAGAATVMPLAAPIGTNKGLQTRDFLRIIIEQSNVPVVVDAGIGAPSHAAEAMEMGAAACLVNTAIAVAGNPVEMAVAFKEAVIAGRRAYEAGLGIQADNLVASASSPLTSFLNE